MLLLICHHLVIDGISWRILVEELQIIYSQLAQGKAIQLPAKTTSYNVWTARLKDYASMPALNEEIAYWLAPERRDIAAVPLDYPTALGANSEASARSIDISLTVEETKALLHDLPQIYHTHIHEVLLVALVQACSPWVGRNRLLVDLEMHGREDLFDDVDVSRTIGWFTSLFPLLLDLEHLSPSPAIAIDPGLAIKAIKEQVRSVPRHGI